MFTSEKLEKANKMLETVDIKGKAYVMVNKRIQAFRSMEPGGSITTELVEFDKDHCVFKAIVCDEEGRVLGVGHAWELASSSYINKTSYVENCETSAIGRALGAVGIGIDASYASAEEVANAIKQQSQRKNQPKGAEIIDMKPAEKITAGGVDTIENMVNETGTDLDKLCKHYGVKSLSELTMEQGTDCISKLRKKNEKDKQ